MRSVIGLVFISRTNAETPVLAHRFVGRHIERVVELVCYEARGDLLQIPQFDDLVVDGL
jgi:hypothetical protein